MNHKATLIYFLSNLSKTTLSAARKDFSEEREKLIQQAREEADDEETLQELDNLRAEIEHFVDLIDDAMKTAFYD